MVRQEFVWMIGGPQGSRVDSAANIFARACCHSGLQAQLILLHDNLDLEEKPII
jgi:Pyruvate/2-oxoacid:ferredoxin oxidoreductase gamma subunit